MMDKVSMVKINILVANGEKSCCTAVFFLGCSDLFLNFSYVKKSLSSHKYIGMSVLFLNTESNGSINYQYSPHSACLHLVYAAVISQQHLCVHY